MHLKSHLTDESKVKRTGKIETLKRKQISVVGPDGGSIEPIITEEGFCECPLCAKTFQLRSVFVLTLHIRNPIDWKLNPAGTYSKTLPRKSYNEHVLTHIKTKDVECDICLKKYRTQKHLKRHKARIHSSKSKLPCPECKQQFSTAKGTGSWNHCLIFDAQYYIESFLRTRTSY